MGVDAKKLKYKSCLLHEIARLDNFKNLDNAHDHLLKKGKLLLEAMPGMINTLNGDLETPLDRAKKSLEKQHKFGAYEELIALFRQYGGKPACELEQRTYEPKKKNKSKNKRQNCIIS